MQDRLTHKPVSEWSIQLHTGKSVSNISYFSSKISSIVTVVTVTVANGLKNEFNIDF